MKLGLKTIKRQILELKDNGYSHVWIYYLIQIVSVALISYITVVFSKTIIDLFIKENLEEVLLYTGIYTGILCIVVFGKVFTNSKTSNIFLNIRLIQFEKYYDKYLNIDYIHLEDADFQKKIEPSLVALSSNNYGFEYTYTLSFQLISLFISALVYIIILTQFNYYITLACFLGMIINYFIYKKISNIEYEEKDNLALKRRKTGYFYNTTYDFSYGKDIRLYDLDKHLIDSYKNESKGLLRIYNKIKGKSLFLKLFEIISIVIRNGLAYYLIIESYFNQNLEISSVMMLLTSITLLSINLNDIGIKAGLFSQHLKYTQDYYKYIDSKEITYEKGNELPLLNDIEINLVDVSFKYPNSDKYILKNINLKIDSNSKIAIVGENGAGKTTLIKLICGLLRPTEGKIFVNNIDSALFSQKAYYKMFGMVFQDTAIFAGSILENVMGTKKENIEFAKLAINKSGLEEKVNSLELKYDQPLLKVIHSNGIDLSGGQIQKLNIARAIYKDAPIVILDEPTASLDALAEEQIYSDFNEVAKNKTSIFISHRLSSTKFCDKIILLTKEGIKESGTHDELIKEKGLYYKMFEVQGKYYQEVEA